jgi:acyl dehydratase
MAYQACPSIQETKTGVNYGFNKVRFISPVLAGKRVRGRFRLKDLNTDTPGRWTSTYEVTVEIEGADKPALAAEWLGAGLM